MRKTLILSILILAACGGSNTQTITEPTSVLEFETKTFVDNLVLDVPKGALPDGVSMNDISLEKIIRDDGAIEFKLEPDGTRFKERVKLTVPLQDGETPMFFHEYQGFAEPMVGVSYFAQADNSYAEVRLDHFSSVIYQLGLPPIWNFELTAADTVVGDNVPLHFSIKPKAGDIDYAVADGSIPSLHLLEAGRTIYGSFWGSDNVLPGALLDRPPTNAFRESYTLNLNEHVCTKAGPAYMVYDIWLSWGIAFSTGVGAVFDEDRPYPDWASFKIKTNFNCLPKPPQPPELKCGNEIIDDGEQCDGSNLNRKYCHSFDMDEGPLKCDAECYFDTSACKRRLEISCNENAWTDEGDDTWGANCSDDCPEGLICGTGCKCTYPTPPPPQPKITGKFTLPNGKVIDFGEPEPEPKEEEEYDGPLPGMDGDTDTEISSSEPTTEPIMVEVIEWGEHLVPRDQIHSGSGPECDKKEHWHADSSTVTTLAGNVVDHPNAEGCGFGLTADIPVISVEDPR